MRITSLVLVYILYPEILRKCFSLMNCIELDNSTGFKSLRLSPNLECWDSRHTKWVLAVALPGLIFWGIMIPLIILKALKHYQKPIIIFLSIKDQKSNSQRNKEKDFPLPNSSLRFEFKQQLDDDIALSSIQKSSKIKDKVACENSKLKSRFTSRNTPIPNPFSHNNETLGLNSNDSLVKKIEISSDEKLKINKEEETLSLSAVKIVLNFGFFYRGYRQDCFYWEIVMFSRKFLLIFIGIFTEFFPKSSKATIFLVIINIYIYLQIKYKPYRHDYLNRLEILSLLVCFFTGNVGVLLFSPDIKKAAVFFLIIVLVLNLGFILFWLHQVVYRAIGKDHICSIFLKFIQSILKLLRILKQKK